MFGVEPDDIWPQQPDDQADAQAAPFPQAGEQAGRNGRLHALLVQAGETYESFADKIGVDPKTVQRWVFLGRTPHRGTAKKVADLLGVEVSYLWPPLGWQQVVSQTVTPGDIRDKLAVRRQIIQDNIGKLQAELTYLDAVLSIPVPVV